jgi:hypothetical protein
MTNHPHRARDGGEEPPPIPMPVLFCMVCIQLLKEAEMQGAAEADRPPVQPAIAIVGGTSACMGHIVIQRQSPLVGANGHGLPPGLRRPGG